MRIKINVLGNKEPIPFAYKEAIKNMFHRATGFDPKLHQDMSLYTMSNLIGTKISPLKNGLDCISKEDSNNNTYFYISAYDNNLIFKILNYWDENPDLFCGMKILGMNIINNPTFNDLPQKFHTRSPIFLKKKIFENRVEKSIYFKERTKEANDKMTNIMIKKLKIAGMNNEDIKIYFDEEYNDFKTKVVSYKNLELKCIQCPVIIEGSPKVKLFAWNVGVGNSTGIGLGLLI